MHRFLHVGINFLGEPKFSALEPVINSIADDWIRYGGNCWILWTSKTPEQCSNVLRAHLTGDQFLVLPIDRTDQAQGWMPQWIWDWINRSRPATLPPNYPGALSGYLPQTPQPPGPPGKLTPQALFPPPNKR